jgi:hypothetical protein
MPKTGDAIPMMPPSYYEFLKGCRPYVVELAEQDAADLLKRSLPPETIGSVDDYDGNRFGQCIAIAEEKVIGPLSLASGLAISEIKQLIPSELPDLRAELLSLYTTLNHEYHSLVNFALSSKKTFHINDNLADHLANTEVNVKSSLIQLPFPSALFTFTSRSVINAMHNMRGARGRLDMNDARLDYTAPVSVFLTTLPADKLMGGRKLVICAWHAKLPDKCYFMLKRELYLGDDWVLEQSIRTDWENLTPSNIGNGMNINREEHVIGAQDDDSFYTDGFVFYRIILNAVLYLSSDQAELTDRVSPRRDIEARATNLISLTKRRKLLQSGGRYTDFDYQEVGSSVGAIVIDRSALGGASGGRVSGKPLVRFMVRGHWRQQAHGAGRQDRRLVWIRPFYKGVDMATAINKPYLVK